MAGGASGSLPSAPMSNPFSPAPFSREPFLREPGSSPLFELEDLGYEECEHIVGNDPDTSLCGIDQTDVPWNQGFPVCQACLAVAQGRLS